MHQWDPSDEEFIVWIEHIRNRVLLTEGYEISEPENERAPNEVFLGIASTYAKKIWHLITLYSKEYYFFAVQADMHQKASLAQAQVMTLRYMLKVHAIGTYGVPLTADIDIRKGWKVVHCLPEIPPVQTESRRIITTVRPKINAWEVSDNSESAKIIH